MRQYEPGQIGEVQGKKDIVAGFLFFSDGISRLADMAGFRQLLLLGVALLFAGCAHYPPNQPLDRHDPAYGYRFTNLASPENSDDMLVVVTFSGGGTRAAALAYGVLEHLAHTEIMREGKQQRLLDEIDIISSVSGGSFTSAYYALYGDQIFSDFESRFLKRDVQGELTRKMLAPFNLARASSPKFGRIDLVAEYLDEEIFHHGTYGDLLKRGKRPFVMINASDMSLGTRFEFTQDQFDLICSDLSSFSLARAVAASSAVPLLFSPLTVRNYSGKCDYHEPAQVTEKSNGTSRQIYKAAEVRSYLDSQARPYLHLLDGGITDNIGLRGMLDRVASHDGPRSLAHAMRLDRLHKAVLIIVNAETAPDLSLDRREEVPTVTQVFRAIKDIPINRYSFETTELLKANFENWARQMRGRNSGNQQASQAEAEFDFYLVEVTFDAIKDPDERNFFRGIPTSYALPAETVDQLRALGPRLIGESEDYQRLLHDLWKN
ncbi:MAG: patatin-like phospholipase family protein [Gammaproteobacteria bacterium]|nr:patatin-like phospholipase family protein [Gammaproteobacteria bacterium]MBU1732549.1 patatin-like phospholipase family protein [Gammaproteobacteria bacterium]MBU1893412.1 patatin-like phospholipase family protein [Gammaproteobacteria bacterium]